MQPLSKFKRRLYLYGLITVFIVCLPPVMFYANGYRFKSDLGFVKTGSIIISVSGAGARVSVDGEEVGTSGFLRHNFYVDNLTPGSYMVDVVREGDYSWHRELVVEQEIVTDAQALLVPKVSTPVRLFDATKVASTTPAIPHATYEAYRAAFVPSKATSTFALFAPKTDNETIAVTQGDIVVFWNRKDVIPPGYFCIRPSSCADEILVERGSEQAIRGEFFDGAVVYATKEGGVFLAEKDVRPTPIFVPLYPVGGADFRIIDGHLIVKDGTALYEITGL